MLKRITTAFLFCSISAMVLVAQNPSRFSIFYYLQGETNGIKATIPLNTFIPDYYKYLIDRKDPTSEFSQQYLQDSLPVFIRPFKFIIQNTTSSAIEMAKTLDSLIVASGDIQVEYSLSNANPSYPDRLIRMAKASVTVPSPFDIMSIMYSQAELAKAIRFSSILVTIDQNLQKAKLSSTDDAKYLETIANMQKKVREASLLYGDYLIRMGNTDIPLDFVISLEEIK